MTVLLTSQSGVEVSLRGILDYSPDNGQFIWLPRPRELFRSLRQFSTWNSRFSMRPALINKTTHGYLNGGIFGRIYRAHRVAWAIAHDEWPDTIDHINGDKSDNRLKNLRSVAQAENCRNARISRNNTSGVRGVCLRKCDQKWSVMIGIDSKRLHIGNFHNFADAVEARKLAEKEFGYHPNHGRVS